VRRRPAATDHSSRSPSRPLLWRAVAVIGILAVAAVTVGGLLQLRFDTSVASLFPKGDQTSLDYDAAQKSFGSEPITVLLQQPGKARQMVSTKHSGATTAGGRTVEAQGR
jgi:predicted RND superfamily exporter protein